jgi:dimethylglycine dehydrogenase
MAERYHKRFFKEVPLPEGTTFESRTDTMCGFNVAGPKSRDILQRLTNTSLATADFPFMRSKWIELGGVRCLALRVSFTGDLGWELHCEEGDQAALYAALIAAGRDVDAGPVGSRALMSLRVEKGYGSWGREYSPEYYPQEVGLGRVCKLEKPFLNREAVTETMAKPAREELVLLALDGKQTDASNADATGGEPIFKDGVGIGRVTSGAYGYSVGLSLALGFVQGVKGGDMVDVMVLGVAHQATVLAEPPFDPKGARLRA